MNFRYCLILFIVLCICISIVVAQIVDTMQITPVKQESSLLEIHKGNHAKILTFCIGDREFAYLIESKDFDFEKCRFIIKYAMEISVILIALLTAWFVFIKKYFFKKSKRSK